MRLDGRRLRGGFVSFFERETGASVNIWRLAQESVRLFRLYDPIYVGVGAELLYMIPTKKKSLPPMKQISTYVK